MIVCEYQGARVDRTDDGKWICRIWAMRGPTGCMKDKEIPEKYAKPIEKAYQYSLKNPEERFTELMVIGSIVNTKDGPKLIKNVKPEPKKKAVKAKPKAKPKAPVKAKAKVKPKAPAKTRAKAPVKKRKAKVPKGGTIKKKKATTLGGGFNPFE